MTDLLAVVSAPPIATTTIRHVEVLLLQPQVAMVVVITSTGGVTKRVISYDEPVDPGLVDWAGSYLSESLDGMTIGTRSIIVRLTDQSLGSAERAFLATLAPAFTELEETAEDSLYFGGAARLLQEERFQELSQINELMQLLERRKALLALVRHALDAPKIWLSIGTENEAPELRSLSVVASGYGLANRRLGAVSVMGPVRMDYAQAITSVRQAAAELSRFVEDIYEE
jgi:heat-inducible transcriptional repressor